eukprot:gene516-147_t
MAGREWKVFPQQSYHFTETVQPKIKAEPRYLVRLKKKYEKQGMRRTVLGLPLLHVNGHPHVIAMKNTKTGKYELMGGSLRPGEADHDGLERKMKKYIQFTEPEASSGGFGSAKKYQKKQNLEVKVGDCISVWWRPNFDEQLYPYLPPQVTRPKESVKVYSVTLPQQCMFVMPKDYVMADIPLFDLFRNPDKFGQILRAVPMMCSTYSVSCYKALD